MTGVVETQRGIGGLAVYMGGRRPTLSETTSIILNVERNGGADQAIRCVCVLNC